MGRFRKFALLVSVACLGSQAHAATYQFTGSITTETWNSDDTTGQGLGLVHAGDVIKGTFDYTPAAPVSKPGTGAVFSDVILGSKLKVYRGGSLIVTLTQAPAFFSNGAPVDQSSMFVRDGDPTGLRDTLNFQAGGGGGYDPADPTGTVVTPISLDPSHPNIQIPGWAITFREKCISGTVAGGNCVSNDPGLDYYDGTQTAFDLVKAFQNNSARDLILTFQYAGTPGQFDGDFEQAIGLVESMVAVPEPATWALMIAGFGLMGTTLRRRRVSRLSFI